MNICLYSVCLNPEERYIREKPFYPQISCPALAHALAIAGYRQMDADFKNKIQVYVNL